MSPRVATSACASLPASPGVDTLADTLAQVDAVTLGDKRSITCVRVSTSACASLRASPGVDTMADKLAEVDAVPLGEKRSYTHALVATLAVTVAEVEVEKLGET